MIPPDILHLIPPDLRFGSLQAENIRHVIFARVSVLAPKRGADGAAGKDRTIGGKVAQDHALALPGKDHVVFAHDIPTTDCREPDGTGPAGPGDPVAATVGDVIQRHAQPLGRGLPEHQGRTRRRVDLLVVMGLDHFDIEVLAKCLGHLAGQAHQQVHPQRHVAGPDHDGMAGGVVAALAAQGMDGIPVSGQDGDHAALNRVALGTQTVSVWKDSRELGRNAGEIAVALANGTAMADIPGAAEFTSPGGVTVNSMLLAPLPVTQDKLNLVLDAGWIEKDVLCQGVTGLAVCE